MLMVSTAIETYSGNVTEARHLKKLGGWKGRHRDVGPRKVDSCPEFSLLIPTLGQQKLVT